MTATHTTHYRCDRCGTDSLEVGGFPHWFALDIKGMSEDSPWIQSLMGGTQHLCPICKTAFCRFMEGRS